MTSPASRAVEWDHHAIACGVMVVDADGVIVELNQAMADMIGAPIDVALGLRIDESGDWIGRFFYEDGGSIPDDELPIMRALLTGEAIDGLVIGTVTEAQEEPRWTLLSVIPLATAEGTVTGAVATVTEITAQKRAEALLARTTAELHGVIHALPDLYFHLDTDGLVDDYHISEGFDVHVEPEALVGRRPAEFLPAEMRGGARKAYAEARLSGRTVVFEAASEVGGEIAHYELRYVALPGGEMVVVIRDVTEQRVAEEAVRRSEERYRVMFERSTFGLFLFDTDLAVTQCNESFLRSTGMPREYFNGLDLLSLNDQRIIPALRAALAGEVGHYQGEYRPTAGGVGGIVNLFSQPLFGARDEILGGIGILASMRPADADESD